MQHDLQIDHLLTKVESPQDAGAWFERCGFTVTPLSVIGSMGLCNRLVLFAPEVEGTANFVELMGTVPGQAVLPAMAELLQGEEGTRSMVLVSQEAHATRTALAERGFAPGPVHHVTRQWALPGETLDLEFDVLLPMAAPLAFNVCRYFTLQHYRRPAWTAHANGVQRLEAVYGVVDDPDAAAAFYERLLGVPAERPHADERVLRAGAVSLELCTPVRYAERGGRTRGVGLAGYRLRCADAGLAAGWFERAGAPLRRGASGVALTAFGNDIVLV